MKKRILVVSLVILALSLAFSTGCRPRDAKKYALTFAPSVAVTPAPTATPTPLPCLANYRGMLDISSGPASVTGNTGDSVNLFSPCGYGSSAPEHVYSFYVPSPMTLVFTVCNNYSYDTMLALSDNCTGSNFFACNDDSCGLGSYISCSFGSAGVYFVVVDAFSSGSGIYTLEVYEDD